MPPTDRETDGEPIGQAGADRGDGIGEDEEKEE